jgi:hypothetical protein
MGNFSLFILVLCILHLTHGLLGGRHQAANQVSVFESSLLSLCNTFELVEYMTKWPMFHFRKNLAVLMQENTLSL